MPIVSLEAAKNQLNVTEHDDDTLIETFISAAIGMVEHAIQRDLYKTHAEAPNDAVNIIIFADLKQSKQAAIQSAIMLAISTLYVYRESDLDVDLSVNPAFNACLSGFTEVVVG